MVRVLALAAAAALISIPSAGAAPRLDHAGVALNVLPPGQSGDLLFPPTASDQLRLYDGLTPRAGNVRPSDLTRYFKSERFGVTGKVVRTERPRRGLRILRDRWGVPHVYGRTRADVEFGAGYATAEDRFILLELLRGPGRLAALDVPGLDPFALATSGRQFVPSAAADERISQQLALIRSSGAKGRQLYADVRSYVAGINAYYVRRNQGLRPWTMTDVIAVGSLLGANLGVGGGDEIRRSMFLNALTLQLGGARGFSTWRWLAQREEPDAPVSVEDDVPVRHRRGAAARERRPRRRQLPPERRRLTARVPLPQSRGGEQCAARLGAPLAHASSALRRGAAGRLLVSRDPPRARPSRRRDRCARRVLPRPQLLRPARARQGLRLERDLGQLDIVDQYVETLCG